MPQTKKSLVPIALFSSLFLGPVFGQGDITSVCPETCTVTAATNSSGAIAGATLDAWWTGSENGNAMPTPPSCTTCQSCRSTFNFSFQKPAGVTGGYQHTWNGTPGPWAYWDQSPMPTVSGSALRLLDCGGSYEFNATMVDNANGIYMSRQALLTCGSC